MPNLHAKEEENIDDNLSITPGSDSSEDDLPEMVSSALESTKMPFPPSFYPTLLRKSLRSALSFVGIYSIITLDSFLSGLALKEVDQDTLAALSLIRSELIIATSLFSSPLLAIGITVGRDVKAQRPKDDIARTLQ